MLKFRALICNYQTCILSQTRYYSTNSNPCVPLPTHPFHNLPEDLLKDIKRLNFFVESRNLKMAQVLFQSLKMRIPSEKRDVLRIVYNTYLKGLAKQNPKEAEHLLQEMFERKVEITDRTYGKMMKGYVTHLQPKKAEEFIKKYNVEENRVHYGILLDGYLKTGNLAKVNEIIEEMRNKNLDLADSYSYLIQYHIKRNEMKEALNIFSKMKDEGVTPNLKTYHFLMFGYALNGDVKSALRLVETIKENNLNVNTETYNILIRAYAKQNDLEKALQIFNEMKRNNIRLDSYTFSPLITLYIKLGKYKEALRILREEMPKYGVYPTITNYNAFISKIKPEEVDLAYTLLTEMRNRNIIPDLLTFKALISKHISLDEMQRIKSLLLLMQQLSIKPNLEIYLPIIKYLMNKGKIGEIKSLVKQMKKNNIQMDKEMKKILKELKIKI